MRSSRLFLSALLVLFCVLAPLAAQAATPTVTAYVSLDREFAQPILDEFEKKSGIHVQPVYDVEASKTVAQVNRLIAERRRPLCDVFWNNELLQTLRLKSLGVLAPYLSPAADLPAQWRDPAGYWSAFSARTRVILYNKNKIQASAAPLSLLDWGKNPAQKGLLAVGDQHFGMSSTHLAALAQCLGREKATAMIDQWKEGEVAVLPGNAAVRNEVAAGRYAAGLVDSDDAFGAVDEGKPVGILYPKENLLVPNSVALINNAPHPVEAKKLIDFLLRPETEKELAASAPYQIPLRPDVPRPARVPQTQAISRLPVDWNKMLANWPLAIQLADRLQEK